MNQTGRMAGAKRVLGAMALAILWLAGAGGGIAADASATTNKPAVVADEAVLLDSNTLWRHCHLEGPSFFLMDDPKVPAGNFSRDLVKTGAGTMAAVGFRVPGNSSSPCPWPWEATSSPPPSDWAGVAFDDSAWLRTYWPQPLSDSFATKFSEGHLPEKRASPFDTVVVLARSRFEIKDPAQVKTCRFSLDYWGGVAVYVNGKEVTRSHLRRPEESDPLVDQKADAYPADILPSSRPRPEDKRTPAGCVRQLREVEIPVALLRPGVNVLAVEAHPAPIPYSVWKGYNEYYTWPPIGVLKARLTVSPADAAVTHGASLRGLQVWNCAVSDTLTVGNDLRDGNTPVEPVLIHAARNSVFSGRLIVGSDQPIKGLTVTVGDLTLVPKSGSESGAAAPPRVLEGVDIKELAAARAAAPRGVPASGSSPGQAGATAAGVNQGQGRVSRPPPTATKLAASEVLVRYAVPAVAGKTWVAPGRFDGLLEQIPAEIPTSDGSWVREELHGLPGGSRPAETKALAPLWFTVRVPENVRAGRYEGRITIAAQGFPAQTVPLQVQVYDYVLPEPRDWRFQNFIYHAEEVTAKYYGVPNYSDRHFELVSKTLALLAEVNSRQVQVNLVCDFFANGYGGSMQSNPESLVRWIKQADGSYKHDFTNFDRYLEMVAKTIGKPRTLRLNCWGEPNPQSAGGWISRDFDNTGARSVTVLDPATGQLSRLKQPPLGTEENYQFWKPVFDEVLKKIKARGWLDETTLGYNAWFASSFRTLADVANRLWPGGEWSFTGHNGAQDMVFKVTGADKDDMIVRHADTVYVAPRGGTPLWLLDGPRRNTFIFGCRCYQREEYPLHRMRTLIENYGVNSGFDGVGDFGADLFPLKRPVGGYFIPAAGAGTGWSSDHRSTLALLYPSADGPVATERFEMLREGAEACEAFLFIRHALAKKTDLLPPGLQQRAKRYVREREAAINRAAFRVRFMPSEEDAKVLALAAEVAGALSGEKPAAPVSVDEARTTIMATKAKGANAKPFEIAGGTAAEYNDPKGVRWTVLTFTNSGTVRFGGDGFVQVLVVGGGGGGGGGAYFGAGGGGAGGVVFCQAYPVTAGQNYPVIVGAGGNGGATQSNDGGNGGHSRFGPLQALGGGGGGCAGGGSGCTGGSGGGAARTADPGLGHHGMDGGCGLDVAGSHGGGGGGGCTGTGGNGSGKAGGNGGDGIDMTWWLGSAVAGDGGWFAGGGVGGTYDDAGNATKPKGGGGYTGAINGLPNSGGGGASARKSQPVGGNGGSGIVMVRFVWKDK